MIEWIKGNTHLQQAQKEPMDFLGLIFYANFSSAAKRALAEVEQFSTENKKMSIYIIDVERVKGVHKQFGVENIPTFVAVKKGKVSLRIEGVEGAQFYSHLLCESNFSSYKSNEGKLSQQVVVYSSPNYPACQTVKAYSRRRSIIFEK